MTLSVWSLLFGWIVIATDVRCMAEARALAHSHYSSQRPIKARMGGSYCPYVVRSGKDWAVMVEAYDRATGRETYVRNLDMTQDMR